MKTLLSALLLMLALLPAAAGAQPVPQYQLSIQNRVLVGSAYQFDVYVKRVGATNFRLGNSQFILTFNAAAFTAPAVSRLASSEAIGTGFFFDHVLSGTEVRISLGGNGTYAGATDIGATGDGTRISTYQIAGATLPTPLANLTWVNLPNTVRTGVSEIDASDNYRDITDADSHLNSYIITAEAGAHGVISGAGETVVTGGATQAYTITPDPGYHVDSLFIDGGLIASSTSHSFVGVTADHTIRAAFAPNQIQITVQTSPPGLAVIVDGLPYTAPQTFTWTAATAHTIGADSIQAGVTGTRHLWQSWSDAGARTHSAGALGDSTFTATFGTEFYLTTAAGTGGAVAPPSGWFASGAAVNISASAGTGYEFTSWTGAGAGSYTGAVNASSVTMSGPITETASFSLITIHVTVQTSPGSGLSFIVDGTPYTSTQVFAWSYGTPHTIGTTSPQAGAPGTRSVWANWSDAGAMAHSVSPVSDSTFTVSFTTQYTLTMVAGVGGTVLPPSGWFDDGQSVPISAAPAVGKSFSGWNGSGTGSYSGPLNPSSVTMNGPITETASFTSVPISVTVTSSPVGLSVIVDGIPYPTPQTFIWDHSSTHVLSATTPQAAAPGMRFAWSNWSDGGAISRSFVPDRDTVVTCVFATQYLLILAAGTGGSAAPNPVSGDGWYDQGAIVQLTATAAPGYTFGAWIGSGIDGYTGTNNPASVTMNSPVGDSAWFSQDDYVISASSGPNGAIAPAGTLHSTYGQNQSFNFTPGQYYEVDSVVVDGGYIGSPSSYAFTAIAASHTISVTFRLQSAYTALYRTFTYQELPIGKAIKKKAAYYYWEFVVKNVDAATVTQVNVTFEREVLTIISSGNLDAIGSRKRWTFYGTLAPNDSFVIKGRSVKPAPQRIQMVWYGNYSHPPYLQNILPIVQTPEFPMPNTANVRDDAFRRGAFSLTDGLLVGLRRIDSARSYGWVRLRSSRAMFYSLIWRTVLHTGTPRGFDTFDFHARPFVREQRNLPPRVQNNRLFANLMTLHFNIAISRIGITQPGLGELRFVESSNPYSTMLVRDIAKKADTLMTHHTAAHETYMLLDSTIAKLNAAFSGVMDTVSWADSLRVKGTRTLLEALYLEPTDVPPEIMVAGRTTGEELPELFSLDQNFPNPFNPATTIAFTLPTESAVTLTVYDIVGREVAKLADNEPMTEGPQELFFDASRCATGVYFYRLVAEGLPDEDGSIPASRLTAVRKMLLVK